MLRRLVSMGMLGTKHNKITKENYMKKLIKIMIASAAALPIVGIASMSFASAATGTTTTNWRDTFVQNLATKFNLNKDDVTKFMDEQKAARETEIKTKVSDALKAAGFTDAQVSALQTKQDEQHTAGKAWRDANPNATRAESKAHMFTERAAFETWAKDQGIDLTKVKDTIKAAGLGMMGGHGHGGRMMDGDSTAPADAPAN